MKNYFKNFLTLFILLILNSCSKTTPDGIAYNDSNQQYKNDQLYLDSSFKTLVSQENELKEIILAIAKKNKITADSLAIKIEKIKVSSKDSIDLRNRLNNLGYPLLYEYLKAFSVKSLVSWTNMNKRFISISSNDIKEACGKYYNQQYLMKINEINKLVTNSNDTKSNNLVSGCGWSYNFCIAGVTAGAILCHAGCIGLTAGFGAPVCLALCGTMQIAGGVGCMGSYCNFNQ